MRRHELDPVSLALGVALVALATASLAGGDVADLARVWPATLVALGALILGLAVRQARREEEGEEGD